MASLQDRFDDAMFDFSAGDYDGAIARLRALLAEEPAHFDAQLALGMAYYRRGDYASAIAEGLKAEQLKPHEQLVHTNLSLFYLKAGDKARAEHHGVQARIASWKADASRPAAADAAADNNPDLGMAGPGRHPANPPQAFPDMPWKRKA
jgi:Flp pilus assembly protein TadD